MGEHPLSEETDDVEATQEMVARTLAFCEQNDISYTIHEDGSIDIKGEPVFEVK